VPFISTERIITGRNRRLMAEMTEAESDGQRRYIAIKRTRPAIARTTMRPPCRMPMSHCRLPEKSPPADNLPAKIRPARTIPRAIFLWWRHFNLTPAIRSRDPSNLTDEHTSSSFLRPRMPDVMYPGTRSIWLFRPEAIAFGAELYFASFYFFFFLARSPSSVGRSPQNLASYCEVCSVLESWSKISGGELRIKKLGTKNMQNSARFRMTSKFDGEYLRNRRRYSKSDKNLIDRDLSRVRRTLVY